MPALEAPGDGANLAIVYTAEEHGSLDTCGCAVRPRGSLARVKGYTDARRKADPTVPYLLVDVGAWLEDATYPDGSLQEHVPVKNAYFVQGLEQGGWNALGVGWRDVPYLASLPAGAGVERAVSANVPGLPPYRTLTAGGVKVAITSVTGPGMTFKHVAGHAPTDPVEALRALVPRLRGADAAEGSVDADVVVVLAFDTDDATRAIVRELPGVDVVIEADEYREPFGNLGDADTTWVRADADGMQVGELRLRVDDGAVAFVSDVHTDLDDEVPADRALWRLRKEQAAALR